jgi:DNA-binding MarR family transcriptional regulator
MLTMARPLQFPEKLLVRLPEGTMQRLRLLVGDKQVTPLIRDLIEKELLRRERSPDSAKRSR